MVECKLHEFHLCICCVWLHGGVFLVAAWSPARMQLHCVEPW